MILLAISVICAVCAVLATVLCLSSRQECLSLRYELDRLNDERNIVIDFLHRIAEDVGNGASRQEMFNAIVRATATACGAMGACVYERLPDGKFKSAATEGLFPPLTRKIPAQEKNQTRSKFLEEAMEGEIVEPNEGIVGEVVRDNRGTLIKDAIKDPRVIEHADSALKIRSLMVVPVSFRETHYGALAVANPINGKSFSQTDFSLALSLGEQAGVALHNLDAVSALIMKNKMDFDLRLASSVQRYLLPSHMPKSDKLEFAVKYFPQQLIGGDFYDFFKLSNGKFALVIGDVSGKGVSAAILMALCQTKLRYIAYTNKSPAETLKILNSEMLSAMRADMFITMVYAIIDTVESKITFARAGHELPMLYKAKNPDAPAELIKGEGMAVGMVEPELFNESISDTTVPFLRGDVFALYTDGMTETLNAGGEEFGGRRLAQTLSALSSRNAQEIADGLIKSVERFKGDTSTPYSDDLTLLIVKNCNNI